MVKVMLPTPVADGRCHGCQCKGRCRCAVVVGDGEGRAVERRTPRILDDRSEGLGVLDGAVIRDRDRDRLRRAAGGKVDGHGVAPAVVAIVAEAMVLDGAEVNGLGADAR